MTLLRDDSPWPWRNWRLVGSFRLSVATAATETRTFRTKDGPHRLTFMLEERQFHRECDGGATVFKVV